MKTKGKAHTAETDANEAGLIRRSARAVKRLFSRSSDSEPALRSSPGSPVTSEAKSSAPGRAPQLKTDVPIDILERSYIPAAMSSKASFRSDGSDHQQGQEFSDDVEVRWNDEDRYTNKSGDPRIGTHGRTYEPGESRDQSRQQ